jgi:protein-L-isoaspartate(D-aspartate) O-methyltransferase
MTEDNFEKLRKQMVETQLKRRGINDSRVLSAMGKVPREEFVPEDQKVLSYEDFPLPIECNQTISQPLMVALMTELLELKGKEKVLEIGTGSGYQAAVLAELAKKVYTIESYKELALNARKILQKLGYKNIEVVTGDGTCGLPNFAPFDAIIVTAGAPKIPRPLVEQLAENGRLVIPLGSRLFQILTRITKKDSKFVTEEFGGCRFVPLIGKCGWGK